VSHPAPSIPGMATPTLHHTAYGRPAVVLLHARIAASKAIDPLRPVTVIVPTNYVGVSTRRLLAGAALGPVSSRGSGIIGLSLLTVYRLAELLGASRLAAQGLRPISTPVLATAIRRVLDEAPGIFAPVREHPSTEDALVRAYRELSEVPAERLDALAATSERAAEVVRVRRAVRRRLGDAWFEEADLLTAARHAIVGGSSILDDLGTVLVHLPQSISPSAAALLTALADRSTVEVIAARTGAADADADVEQALGRLGIRAGGPAPPPAPVTAVVSVSDAEEEVRTAVDRVIAAARSGTPLERMAILYPTERPYARLAAEQLDAAGIAWNGRGVRPLTDRLLGRWLLDLLALPEERFARPAVLGLLSAAPVRTADGRRIAPGTWERISREAGIVRDQAAWRTKLPRYARDLRSRAAREELGDEPRTWLVERLRRSAGAAEELHGFIGALLDRLEVARSARSWAALVGWCHDAITDLLGGEAARHRWPAVEVTAAERVEQALDRLAGLDEVDAEDAVTLHRFRRTLELELAEDLGRVGELGRGVLVGSTSAALGIDLEIVICLGLAEGVSPTRPRQDSLLPDVDREVVGDIMPLRADRTGVEHRHLLAALAAASRERVLVHPRGDLRRSVEHVPSRWLLDAVVARSGDPDAPRALPAGDDGWHEVVPSFAARIVATPFPSTRQEYHLRALHGTAPADLAAHPLVELDAVLRRGADLAQTRGRTAFTRFDGNLAAVAEEITAPGEAERATSASRLEAWLSCPHAYLLSIVLGVEPVENPEELLQIDAMERGSLLHEVLEQWLLARLDEPLPHPGTPWSDAARADLLARGAAACDDAEARGVTGHPLLWRRDRRRILGDLDRFVDADDDRRRRHGLTPQAAERPFGLPGTGTAPVEIPLTDGRVILVRGRIDRVDLAADGTLWVVDYKTGSAKRYQGLSADQPLGRSGTTLQLAIYGLALAAEDPAAASVHSEYWFTSARGDFKRLGYDLTDDVRTALQRALQVAVDGITAGRFPMKPVEPGWRPFNDCQFCDPDDLGTADRHRDWERVRTAPELHDYVTYLTPEVSA
jgi:ATP-dependent helicase/nuclease subunit B